SARAGSTDSGAEGVGRSEAGWIFRRRTDTGRETFEAREVRRCRREIAAGGSSVEGGKFFVCEFADGCRGCGVGGEWDRPREMARRKRLIAVTAAILLLLMPVSAQRATLAPAPWFTVLDSSGNPVSGACIWTYTAGTTTAATTYADANLSTS